MIIMTKFIKKITKLEKFHENCVVIGTVWGNLEDVCEVYDTVFILSDGEQTVRRKNIVYRENFEETSLLPYINSIFVDLDQLEKLIKLENVIKKFKLSVYINHGYHIDDYYHRFFNIRGYQLVEMNKHFQMWKPKK